MTSSPSPLHLAASVGSVVKEVAARNNRRNNVVISGLPQNNATADDVRVRSLITDELHLHELPHFTCKRVGKQTSRPQLLVVSFDDVRFRDRIITNAKNLRSSSSDAIKQHVYISPDLTELERKEQFVLRQELRTRKAAGDDVVILSGKVVPRASSFHRRSTADVTTTHAPTSAADRP